MKTELEIETRNTPHSELLAFHSDEDGMETMQIVMIIAVAAIVLLFVKSQWETISSWASGLISQVTGWTG
ncbi:MAG: hypothetical protein JWN70_4851 [Planctomycetaceae bacterium]|nr:hypothetical protein [Planctomycetaceae bacterium]